MSDPSNSTPRTVGVQFIKVYYNTLYENPQDLPKFYVHDASTSRANASDETEESFIGIKAIKERFNNAAKVFKRVHVTSAEFQPSFQNSILITVTGKILEENKDEVLFVQIFVLTPSPAEGTPKAWFIQNDVIRFLGQAEKSASKNEVEESKAVETKESPVAVAKEERKEQEQEKEKEKSSPVASPAADTTSSPAAEASKPTEPASKPAEKKPEATKPTGEAEQRRGGKSEGRNTPKSTSNRQNKSNAKPAAAKDTTTSAPVQPQAAAAPAKPKSWADIALEAKKDLSAPVAAPAPVKSAADASKQPAKPSPSASKQSNAAKQPNAASANANANAASPASAAKQSQPKTPQSPQFQVKESRKNKKHSSTVTNSPQNHKGTVVVRNLSAANTKESIEAVFTKYGSLQKVHVHNEIAFVEFVDTSSAERVLAKQQDEPFVIDGHEVHVEAKRDRKPGFNNSNNNQNKQNSNFKRRQNDSPHSRDNSNTNKSSATN